VTSTTLSSGSVRRWLTYSLLLGALLLVGLMTMARPAAAAPGQVISDEHAHVKNAGSAVATSGQNTTVGNSSTNVATNDQRHGGRGLAYNSSSNRNTSSGTSETTTGSAMAVGNQSTTSVEQMVNANGFDGLALIRQNFDSANTGSGEAISGMNTGRGNASLNIARTSQGAFTSGATAVNDASSTNGSDGLAMILTGDATATGNTATTNGSQIANATPGSAHGIALIDQTAGVATRGIGTAVTGGNTAIGNASFNVASAVQGAVSARGPPAVATNQGASTNSSNGTAHIHTGDAWASGNSSETYISQEDESEDKLPNISESSSSVTNRGVANATSGANRAAGNTSSNTATTSQGASSFGPAVNSSSADNHSNGSAMIMTGTSTATGNVATTVDADVVNRGNATAVSGRNRAVGNASGNTADNRQAASGARVASNLATVLNDSDGSAEITTGNSSAYGNEATSQDTGTVINRGVATAVSGANSGVGNASGNTAFNSQFALGGFAVNQALVKNHSTGSVDITTGTADATGNRAYTTIGQEDEGSDDPWNDIDQQVVVINRGSAVAVSGANQATGNGSVNDSETFQRALGVRTAVNSSETVSHSDGVASIHTGSASALGNLAQTTVDQTATVTPERSPLALVGQTIVIRNTGGATAVSGRNAGTGNGSANLGLNRQVAGAVAAVHSNTASSASNSAGVVDIDTGSASAVGNSTTTAGSQAFKSMGAAA
jgi:hypothetical protein